MLESKHDREGVRPITDIRRSPQNDDSARFADDAVPPPTHKFFGNDNDIPTAHPVHRGFDDIQIGDGLH
ncbi:hypothetical protein BGLT_00238 [Caballeronia glathei]|jgi:hypothetical protein|uniref:Uncharacterized protein n=1 Tax=Caballeronia glathei TaxID=60547 RepID=A0A069PVZ2_9BURK|nr:MULTISPECIES: hypothetical protein [Burkholderiaceae]KDR44592.1 hypothetical protein BG61_12215 [Caballeronia glathei]TCK44428.1 hypothetical protein B0G84_2797 [Paraburkholderia sp. BL8N3]CDY74058.1 hypothetical protein BGLT_00238 [Caballeronia glathei]